MNTFLKLASVSALALAVAAPVSAQSTVTGVTALNDNIDDITTQVARDQRRGQDAQRFGSTGVAQGFKGSFALTASGTSGNTDTGEVSGAGRLTYGIGDWNHLVGFAVEYGEANGVKNEEKFFATYEASRYFNEQFYMFGLGRYQYDGTLVWFCPAPRPTPSLALAQVTAPSTLQTKHGVFRAAPVPVTTKAQTVCLIQKPRSSCPHVTLLA